MNALTHNLTCGAISRDGIVIITDSSHGNTKLFIPNTPPTSTDCLVPCPSDIQIGQGVGGYAGALP